MGSLNIYKIQDINPEVIFKKNFELLESFLDNDNNADYAYSIESLYNLISILKYKTKIIAYITKDEELELIDIVKSNNRKQLVFKFKLKLGTATFIISKNPDLSLSVFEKYTCCIEKTNLISAMILDTLSTTILY